MKQRIVPISKVDAHEQLVYGEVYAPLSLDTQGDFMTAEEIKKMAHKFLKSGQVNAVDTEHDLKENGSFVVESFIARPGDPDFSEGSWVAGVHVVDPEIWNMVQKGEINGFSMFGKAGREEPRIVEIEIPDDGIIKGDTEPSASADVHIHEFHVELDAEGNVLRGWTSEAGPDSHVHIIKGGTVTEPGGLDVHKHRFDYFKAVINES